MASTMKYCKINLDAYGLDGPRLSMMESFFIGRLHIVNINCYRSEQFPFFNLQRYLNGPLYVNDIKNEIRRTYEVFSSSNNSSVGNVVVWNFRESLQLIVITDIYPKNNSRRDLCSESVNLSQFRSFFKQWYIPNGLKKFKILITCVCIVQYFYCTM